MFADILVLLKRISTKYFLFKWYLHVFLLLYKATNLQWLGINTLTALNIAYWIIH